MHTRNYMLALNEGAPDAKLREWVYVNVYWWSVVDTSAFISDAFRASLQEGSRGLLAKV